MHIVSQVFRSSRPFMWLPVFANTFLVSQRLQDDLVKNGLMAISLCLASSFGFVLNDLVDIEEDRANGKQRLQDLTHKQRQQAMAVAGAQCVFSLCLAVAAGTVAMLSMLAVIFGLILYSTHVRKTILAANLLAAALCASPLWISMLVHSGYDDTCLLWMLAISILVFLGREVAFDAADIAGDSIGGRATIATVFGQRKAVICSLGLQAAVLIICLALLPAIASHSGVLFGAVSAFLLLMAAAMGALYLDTRRVDCRITRFISLSRASLLLSPFIAWHLL